MQIKNSETRFGLVASLLHWLMAVLIIGLLILGLLMVPLPIGHTKLKWYGWHKEYGFLALFLVMFRLGWRLGNITPELDLPLWEKFGARAAHWGFYFFMFAMPITGWCLTSASGLPASFFGLFVMPDLVSPNEDYRLVFQVVHEWMGYGLIAMITLHVTAALKHHFINKDQILVRILPW